MINNETVPIGFAAGCLERDDTLGSQFPVFEDEVTLIPRSDWKDAAAAFAGLETYENRIFDQGQEGSCASNASAQAMEIVRNATLGPERSILFSAMSLYKRVGRNASSGSTISSNLVELRDRGILPLDTDENKALFNHTHPATGFSRRLPDGWEDTARIFRAVEWFDCGSFDAVITALLRGWPVVYGRSGHAICGAKPAWQGGKVGIRYINSWRESWGDKGHGFDTESFVSRAIPSYGAFAIRTVTIPSGTEIP